MRIVARWHSLLLCLLGTLVLVGCGSMPAYQPGASIPNLQGPGVSEIPGVGALLPNRLEYQFIPIIGSYRLPNAPAESANTTAGPIATRTATAAPRPLDSGQRVVVVFGFSTERRYYYDIGIDGSTPHPLPLRIPCAASLAITPDGQWGACVTTQGIATFRLAPSPTSPTATTPLEEHLLLPNNSNVSQDPLYGYGNLSWDPSGHYLLVARSAPSGSADGATAPLDVFVVSPAYDQATLAIHFTSARQFYAARWSPDGQWFYLSGWGNGASFLVSVAQLAPTLPAYGAPTRYLTLYSAELHALSQVIVWRPGTVYQATWFDRDGVLHEQDLVTGQQKVLAKLTFAYPALNQPGYLCAATWTADGRQLLIALCNMSAESRSLPSKLFVYIPSND